jgi:hypothetical protein
MQETNSQIPPQEMQKLVDVFAWLIREDKKENPADYQYKKQE